MLLSRAGKSDRCVASISLRGADDKPVPAAAAKVQWAGEAAPQAVVMGTNAPGRLFTTSSSKSGAAGCQLQVLEVTVAGEQQCGPCCVPSSAVVRGLMRSFLQCSQQQRAQAVVGPAISIHVHSSWQHRQFSVASNLLDIPCQAGQRTAHRADHACNLQSADLSQLNSFA